MNDPIAAALACGRGSDSKLIVYDLGGGAFDVSLLSIDEGVFKVLATAGDTHLGGEDFDNRVIDYLVKVYKEKTGTDVSSDQHAMSELKRAVERAKRTLSLDLSAKIEIESFENGNGFFETLTKDKVEELNLELFERTMELVEQVLKDGKVMKSEIDEVWNFLTKSVYLMILYNKVILVGGSTRIPKVQELLKDYFDKEPSRDINSDEAVVVGATIQAAILSDQVDGITVLNINSLTLGIEANRGVFFPLIGRGTVLPTKTSQMYAALFSMFSFLYNFSLSCSTDTDNQSHVKIKVFEGDQEKTESNHFLGEFKLKGILPAPKGVPQVEITFEQDENSILTIKALDKRT